MSLNGLQLCYQYAAVNVKKIWLSNPKNVTVTVVVKQQIRMWTVSRSQGVEDGAPTGRLYPQVRCVFTFWKQLPLAVSPRLGSPGHCLAELCPFYLVFWSSAPSEALQQSMACSGMTDEQERREEDSRSHTGCAFFQLSLRSFRLFFILLFRLLGSWVLCLLLIPALKMYPFSVIQIYAHLKSSLMQPFLAY